MKNKILAAHDAYGKNIDPMITDSLAHFKAELKRLTELFSANFDSYQSSGYDEAKLRQQFLDPFFEALGWDVRNKKGAVGTLTEVDVETLAAKKQLAEAASDTERNSLQRRIDHLDTQIDATIYTLYLLTPAEIKIIQGSVK